MALRKKKYNCLADHRLELFCLFVANRQNFTLSIHIEMAHLEINRKRVKKLSAFIKYVYFSCPTNNNMALSIGGDGSEIILKFSRTLAYFPDAGYKLTSLAVFLNYV